MIAAVVPAAGHSQRMGRPKLILPVGGQTVIARVVSALRAAGAAPVVVIPPPADAAGAVALHGEAEAAGALLVVPVERPPDMRASVQHGLSFLGRHDVPPSTVLIVPADSPGLNPSLVGRVMAEARANPGAIVVPVSGGKRGHPIALPWSLAITLPTLPAGVGVNALVALHGAKVVEIEVSDRGAVDDLDTPEDYERWRRHDLEGRRFLCGDDPVQ